MATHHKGNGGSITVDGTALPTIDAEIKEFNTLGETSDSGTSGRRTWIGTWTEADFRCTVVFDSDALLGGDLTTVRPGVNVTAKGTLGDSGKFYQGTAVIETIRHYWNNRQGVVEAEVTGKFSGSLTIPAP